MTREEACELYMVLLMSTLAVRYIWGDDAVTHIQGTQNTVKPPDPDIHGSRPLNGLLLRIVCQVYKEKVGDTNCNTFK